VGIAMSPIYDRPGRALALCAALVVALPGAPPALKDEYAAPRAEMVEVIEDHAESVAHILDGALDAAVLEVMRQVPRHAFVPERARDRAYADRPLPIGYGQTISQPFIVALMTHLLAVEPGDAVLEIGTGSGYQAAVLSPMAGRVCTIEIIPELGRSAAERLQRLGFDKVRTRVGDGYYGWEECGPFDGIMVTAAAGHVPPPLIRQLKPGGRMVIPVGGPFVTQQLVLVEKAGDGQLTTRQLIPVRFVPLTRQR
jgi:protein-L-isoaspartate(D-aspartate) O-methyltransferase